LVVIGIIALLISILMPALNRVRDQANRIKCANNLRNILHGITMYVAENKNHLPFANWGGTPPGHQGWLYKDPIPGTQAAVPADFANTGVVYNYLKNIEIFKCPLVGDNMRSAGPSEKITSYLMNGAVQDYPDSSGGLRRSAHKITKFRVVDVLLWESGETRLMNNGPPWNDGSSYPGEWLTERHGSGSRGASNMARGSGGACIACFDGHTEWMSHKEYEREMRRNPATEGPNRFWCAPGRNLGGWRPMF
jgi:type II secretory pathway pseudopilin PulG